MINTVNHVLKLFNYQLIMVGEYLKKSSLFKRVIIIALGTGCPSYKKTCSYLRTYKKKRNQETVKDIFYTNIHTYVSYVYICYKYV